jgi:LCP family protein required for cell wall assembly
MKTTLKRGIGRTTISDGNGHANGRAVFPPDALLPVRFYRQPPKQRRGVLHTVATVALWFVAAVVVVALGVAGGLVLYSERAVQKVRATTPDVRLAERALNTVPAGDPAVALVIGYDKRQGPEANLEPRSDTIMLVRADPDLNTLSMLSLPRDLVVDVRCPGRAPVRGRINEAYLSCGTRGVLETVRSLTNLPVNYLITVNFRGFKKMVAEVGGVWMDVDRRYFNDNSQGGPTYPTIDLQPGYQKLNGQDALDYARYRHFDNDFFRSARQQRFVDAFQEAVTSSFSPTKVPEIVDVITDNVEVGVPGGRTLSRETLWSYGLFAYNLRDGGHTTQAKIDLNCYGENDYAELHVSQACIDRAVREFANPDAEAAEKATNVALGRKPPAAKAPPPRETSVVVLNGNGVAGAAANGAAQLSGLGYVTLDPPNGLDANAPTMAYAHSKAYFDPRVKVAEAAAKRLATLLGEADVEPIPREIRPLSGGAMNVVVLGRSFDGKLARTPVDQTPKRQPPQVYETGEPAAALATIRRQARLRLLAPRRLAKGYTVSDGSPPRAYGVAGQRAARMTFTNGIEYFGLQITTWADAPSLAGPDETVKLRGRTFDLYYSGAKLRMVVLREGGTTYWVVNTLLNSLSNETMLSIARSLRPL